MSRHRALAELSGLEELSPRRRDRVRSHLAHCQRCRDGLSFVRETRSVAGAATAPPAPVDALGRIIARREAGERVILPAERRFEKPSRRLAVRIALGATLVASVAIAADLVVRATRTDDSDSASDPVRVETVESIGISIIPTRSEADVRISATAQIRVEVLIHEGRELGVRGRGVADSARFRTAGGGISVSGVTGGVIEVRIPRGLTGRLYLNDRLELTTDGHALRVERTGELDERVTLDFTR